MQAITHRTGAILVSSILFAVAAEIAVPQAFLVWIALVPWLVSLDRETSVAGAVASGALMSVGYVAAVLSWFAPAVAAYTETPVAFAYVALFIAAPLLQPQFVCFAAARRFVSSRGSGAVLRAVAAASAWTAAESLLPRLFGDSLGHGVYPFATLRQAADLAGAGGLAFVVLLANEGIAAFTANLRIAPWRAVSAAAATAVLVASVGTYGAARIRSVEAAPAGGPPLLTALVQANLADYEALRDREGTWAAAKTILDLHLRLSADALSRDDAIELVIWPETVYPTTFGTPKSEDGEELDGEITQWVDGTGRSLMFGTYDREGGKEFNAAVLLQRRDGEPPHAQTYRKRRLFPLTERAGIFSSVPGAGDGLPWLGSWSTGYGPAIQELRRKQGPPIRIAPLICLDAVDPALSLAAAGEGADALVTLSNDAWFAGTRGARQHLLVSAFRSIETRLPQLRVTPTGISAVISPTGEIEASTPIGQAAILAATLRPGSRGDTVMKTWGDWFGGFSLVLVSLLALFAARRRES